MDKLFTSVQKERPQVKVQFGKRTKFRARTSSIKGSPAKVHYGSPTSDVVSSTSVVATPSSQRPGPHITAKNGLVLYVSTDPSLIAEGDLSDLTSLASSTRSPNSASPIHNDVSNSVLYSPPKASPLAAARHKLKYGQLAEPAWSANDLDSYVWVLLEPKSDCVYDPDRDENDCKERLWWPGKVCSALTL